MKWNRLRMIFLKRIFKTKGRHIHCYHDTWNCFESLQIRIIFFAFMLFSASCSGQPTNENPSKIDTLKLFNPKPEPVSGDDVLMTENCIVLCRQNFTVIHKGVENTFTDLDLLSDHLQKNAAVIRQRKFYVMIDSVTNFQKTLSVLELLQKLTIDNYRVINVDQYFRPPDPVPISMPKSVTSTVLEKDSSYFSIQIVEEGFRLSVRGKKKTVNTQDEIDGFITENKLLIDSRKIMITQMSDVSSEKFNSILEVLKKHEYFSFKIVTQ